tara:strand:+ start:10833 stop:11624 length:792 start_codon:yes stop_codon:yes gene_type:complete
MIRIKRKLKINNFEDTEYTVYTRKEFDSLDKTFKHWSKCNSGDWGISDDGYVAECLQRNIYGTSIEMVFPYGRQWAKRTAKLEFEPHYYSKNYSNVSTKSYSELEASKDRADLAIDAFLAYKTAGKKPDMDKIGKIYRPDQNNPAIAVKKLFKTKEVKKIMADKLKDILLDREIDEGFVLDVIKDAIDTAKVKEDPANMIRAAKELSVFLDMAPKQKQVTESIEMDMSHQIADTYKKQTKKLKATKISEIDDGKEDSNYQVEE